MPISVEVFPSRSFVLSVAQGTITYADCLVYLDTLSLHPAFEPGFRQLLDCTEVDALVLSPGEVRAVASQASRLSQETGWDRFAIAASGDHAFGVARMYEAYTQNLPRAFRVFREVDSAMKWLEAPCVDWGEEAEADGDARAS